MLSGALPTNHDADPDDRGRRADRGSEHRDRDDRSRRPLSSVPGAATADAVVLDDLPRFLLKVGPAEVSEGGGGAVTVEIDNGVSLTTAETISLT